ncbi:hypothetical protein GP486_008096 [Trichoglossum hirsutum]|uniref:Uncharacterized protein n=1 Tax=Trichoglossum hirsutum TaxID=265104 RepID=A0A9P8L7A8_9PEZI|nr:hypothetical protein GP486_008096 [Trichoglossum hirsutum]
MQFLAVSYLLPAVLLNPVLILHTLNSLLCRLLPSFADQPLPKWSDPTTWGPHAIPPYLDVHSSDNLCWVYTIFMVVVQLFAFERISTHRCDDVEKEEAQARTTKVAVAKHEAITGDDAVVAAVEVEVVPQKANVAKKLSDDRGGSKLNTEAYVERLEEWSRKSDAVAGFIVR